MLSLLLVQYFPFLSFILSSSIFIIPYFFMFLFFLSFLFNSSFSCILHIPPLLLPFPFSPSLFYMPLPFLSLPSLFSLSPLYSLFPPSSPPPQYSMPPPQLFVPFSLPFLVTPFSIPLSSSLSVPLFSTILYSSLLHVDLTVLSLFQKAVIFYYNLTHYT